MVDEVAMGEASILVVDLGALLRAAIEPRAAKEQRAVMSHILPVFSPSLPGITTFCRETTESERLEKEVDPIAMPCGGGRKDPAGRDVEDHCEARDLVLAVACRLTIKAQADILAS